MAKPLNQKNQTEYELSTLRDIIAPSAIEVTSNYIKMGIKYAKTFFVFTYPKYLAANWLAPIINMPQPMDISMFIHPYDTVKIMKTLQNQITSITSEIMERDEKGLIRDPMLEAAYQNIEDLRDKLQTAEEKMFKFGLYITIYGDSPKKLERLENEMRALLESRMVYIKPALYQQKEGFNSSLPLAYDELLIHNSLNTEPLSSVFPFVSSDLTSDKGILYGINRHNSSLILFDRFSLENANSVVFAKSGSGKSIRGNEPILIKDSNGRVRYEKIGNIIERVIKKHGINFRDEELEGFTAPPMQVYTFDHELKSQWSKVLLAARKKATEHFYEFTTASGRKITTTGDHNMVALKNGRVVNLKSTEVKKGDYVPLPRFIANKKSDYQKHINLIDLLWSKKIYVKGADGVIKQHYNELKHATIDSHYDQYLCKYRDGRTVPFKYLQKIYAFLRRDIHKDGVNLKICSSRGGTELPAFLPITSELMRIWGYIISEGTIGKGFIQISNLDKEFIDDLTSCLSKIDLPFFRIRSGVVIGSPLFSLISRLCGVRGKSGKKKLPDVIFDVSLKEVADFLRGYFEGDGWVDKNGQVLAVSKSRQLILQLTLLLYRFRIVARIKTKTKRAQGWTRKKTYYELTISGSPALKIFQKQIGFVSKRKNILLANAIKENPNTNLDVVPEVADLFREIAALFGFQLHGIANISSIKRGVFRPSRKLLLKTIRSIEKRINIFRDREPDYSALNSLPELETVVENARNDKALNAKLWMRLGQSWRVVKNEGVSPFYNNAYKIIKTINGSCQELTRIKQLLHSGFQEMDIAVKYYNKSLQSALVARPHSNTSYQTIQKSSSFIWSEYQRIITDNIPQVEARIKILKTLANSDLFWDPIVKVKKLANKNDKYVYDLTVDNGVFLAGQGGLFVHNSYMTKLEVLRSMMLGVDVLVIDPEKEYQFLADTVGGSFFNISLTSEHHINPFDLPPVAKDENPNDVLRSNIITLLGLLKTMLGEMTPEEESVLDEAIAQTYSSRDITPDRRDFEEITPPLMTDLQTILENMQGGESLAIRLKKYTEGIYSGFLNQHTNIALDNQLVVFNIRDMEEELRPVAMYIILNYIWVAIRKTLKKRILIVDEAWWMMQHDDSAAFLFAIAKRARKYFLGLTTITQDIADFMSSSYGKPIVTNSSMQILLRQSPASVDVIQDAFNLTDEEKYLLLESGVGEGLFFAGNKHVAIKVIASYTEDQIITSDPAQLLKIQQAKEELERGE